MNEIRSLSDRQLEQDRLDAAEEINACELLQQAGMRMFSDDWTVEERLFVNLHLLNAIVREQERRHEYDKRIAALERN